MGTTASKPAGAEAHVLPAQVASSQEKKQSDPAACPLGFGQKQTGGDASPQATTAGSDASPAARCPVKGTKGNAAAVDDASSRGDTHAATAATTTAASPAGEGTGGGGAASGCPVKKEDRSRTAKYLHPHKYNVYSQRVDDGAEGKQSKPKPPGNDSSMAGLDPSNNMPVNPNQLPAAGQQVPLSTERVRSTIPKGGEEATWTYPSPQMFWNSLSRKGKVEDTKEDDMDVVVSIHNNMNEFTWKKILQWEKLRKGSGQVEEGTEGSEPRLLRFLGRPDDTTPKALVKMMLGHPLPFDRHDWVVDKGGDERRYVIDYYHDEGAEDVDEMPELHSEGVVKSIKVDVRPALDGFRDLTDRLVQMPLARLTGKCDFSPLPLRPSPTMVSRETWAQARTRPTARDGPNSAPGQQGQESAPTPTPTPTPTSSTSTPTTATASAGVKPPPPQSTPPPPISSKKSGDREARAVARMKKKCALPLKALAAAEGAGDEEKAQTLALKLEYCTARYLCRKEAKAYKEALTFAGGAGSIAGDGHAYWAERAVEGRLSDMRAALAGFTARQQGRRRREGEQQEGQSLSPPPPPPSSSSSSSSSSPPPPPTPAA